jgi:DNA gyrase inhibitor GyrI
MMEFVREWLRVRCHHPVVGPRGALRQDVVVVVQDVVAEDAEEDVVEEDAEEDVVGVDDMLDI